MAIFFNPNRYSIGLSTRVELNNSRVNFGNSQINDSFHNSSVERFLNEDYIRYAISQNVKLKGMLYKHNIPVVLNLKALDDLKNNHMRETQIIAGQIAKNLPPALKEKVNLKDLKDAAILHDVGKVLIPNTILNKNSRLTAEERAIMDLHSEFGYQILRDRGINENVLNLIRHHHDYTPDINNQILNLADKYSALKEKRPYKEEMTPRQALTILQQEVQNGEINPFVFKALVNAMSEENSENFLNIS